MSTSDNILFLPSPIPNLPVPNAAQSFGASRAKYNLKDHNGVDFACDPGTPVTAPLAGVVLTVGYNSLGGNQLTIQHPNGWVTGYAHLSRILVTVGQTVQAGQLIAYTGDTGSASSGPHLHFTLRLSKNSPPTNPWPYLNGTARQQNNAQVNPTTAGQTNNKDYYDVITHDDKSISTVQGFMNRYGIVGLTEDQFMGYKNNKDNILSAYTKKQKKSNNNQASASVLNTGTKLAVPLGNMKSLNPYRINQKLLVGVDYNTFIEAEIGKLINDPKYKRLDLIGSTVSAQGAVYKKISVVSVWLWSRSVSPSGKYLLDLSPFIKSINTNVNIEGGNFTISLPHISYDATENQNQLSTNTNLTQAQISQKYQIPIIDVNKSGNGYLAKSSTHRVEKLSSSNQPSSSPIKGNLSDPENEFFKLKNSVFNQVIQTNDIVFIRLEKLEIDTDHYFGSTKGGYPIIDSSVLQGRVFDMIALVDSNTITSDGKTSTQGVIINGRDISKILIDDGVFFFPISYSVTDKESIVKNSNRLKATDRLFANAKVQDTKGTTNGLSTSNLNFQGGLIAPDGFRFDLASSISDWLLFIFQQLTNISIAPDGLFGSYTDKSFIVSKSDKKRSDGSTNFKSMPASGIWQIIKLVMDPNISERNVWDASLSTDTGSLINLVRKVCQDPFAEFTGDTWGDKYYFTLRKPPFVQASFKTNKTINIYDYDVMATNFEFCSDFYSWYRLTPMGVPIGTSDGILQTLLPAVALPEYVAIWGTKIFDVTTNYIDYDMSVSAESDNVIGNILKQANEDFDWMIESSAYLPFSRRGNITIKADRTIKRGMCVRFMPTGEVFHVDGVSHIRSFEDKAQGATVLAVSRGLVEKHYDKYFSIVNLKRNGTNKNTWGVNTDIFDFFLNKQQFT